MMKIWNLSTFEQNRWILRPKKGKTRVKKKGAQPWVTLLIWSSMLRQRPIQSAGWKQWKNVGHVPSLENPPSPSEPVNINPSPPSFKQTKKVRALSISATQPTDSICLRKSDKARQRMATAAVKIKPCRHAALFLTSFAPKAGESVYYLKVEESKDSPEMLPFGCEMIETTATFRFTWLLKILAYAIALYTWRLPDLWDAPTFAVVTVHCATLWITPPLLCCIMSVSSV